MEKKGNKNYNPVPFLTKFGAGTWKTLSQAVAVVRSEVRKQRPKHNGGRNRFQLLGCMVLLGEGTGKESEARKVKTEEIAQGFSTFLMP